MCCLFYSLRIWLAPIWNNGFDRALTPQTLGFLKGMARSSIALIFFALSVGRQRRGNATLSSLHVPSPGFAFTLSHKGLSKGSRSNHHDVEHAMLHSEGLQTSSRPLPPATPWLSGFLDYTSFLKQWNTWSGRPTMLWNKRLFRCAFRWSRVLVTFSMILACVSEIDWAENPFFDNLSSKNFYSGFQELEVSSTRQDYRDLHGPRDQGPRTPAPVDPQVFSPQPRQERS